MSQSVRIGDLPAEIFVPIIELCIEPPASPSQSDVVYFESLAFKSRLSRLHELMRVSRTWRDYITELPTLWTSITSSDPLSIVSKALDLSRESPLKIYIGDLLWNRDVAVAVEYCREFMELLNPHIERCALAHWHIISLQLFNCLPTTPAPLLKSLNLWVYEPDAYPIYRWGPGIKAPNLFGGVVPSLSTLGLFTTSLGWAPASYAGLRSLHLHHKCLVGCMNHNDIAVIFAACSATLEELIIQSESPDLGDFAEVTPEHADEIDEAIRAQALTNRTLAAHPIRMERLRSIDLRLGQTLSYELLDIFDAPVSESYATSALPLQYIDDENELWSVTLPSYITRHFQTFLRRIPHRAVECVLTVTPSSRARVYLQDLAVIGKHATEYSFLLRTVLGKTEYAWLEAQLPEGHFEREGIECRMSRINAYEYWQSWTPQTIYTMNHVVILRLTLVDDEGPIIQLLGSTVYRAQSSIRHWIFPKLTSLSISSERISDPTAVVAMVERRYGLAHSGARPALAPPENAESFTRFDVKGLRCALDEKSLQNLTRILGEGVLI